MKYIFLFSMILLSSKVRAMTVNCLQADIKKKYATVCGKVLDFSKLKWENEKPVQDTISYIDCLGDLEDGYQRNRCESVQVWKQRRTEAKF